MEGPPAGCAAESERRHVPLAASAPAARAWLLLEHPGPWPPEGPEAVCPDVAAEAVRRIPGLRVLLIRRPHRPAVGRPRVILVGPSATATPPTVETAVVDDYAAVLAGDLERFSTGGRAGLGPAPAAPFLLVCTHGRRDACCAALGRPLARALVALGADVWECSHLGGHRFAGNVVAFPHGLVYGRVRPGDAGALVGAMERGEVLLEHHRGRAGREPAAQAAEQVVRETTGIRAIAQVEPAAVAPLDGGAWAVTLRAGAGGYRVVVRAGPGPATPPSCGAGPEQTVVWRAVSVEPHDP